MLKVTESMEGTTTKISLPQSKFKVVITKKISSRIQAKVHGQLMLITKDQQEEIPIGQ